VPHEVLNAKNHAREAEIVAHAGEKGKITIATNMAGRGTDIKLTQESLDAGGLYILGTERHESRRIDNQLRGRSGRQGDPGESRFYLSPDDNLIRIFGGENFKKRLQFVGMTEDESIESKMFTKNIERMQERVERDNFEIRKNLLEYDDVLNQQRTVIYAYRRMVLEGQAQIFELVRDLMVDAVQDIIRFYAPRRLLTQDAFESLLQALALMMNMNIEQLHKRNFSFVNTETLTQDLIEYLLQEYDLYLEGRDRSMLQEAQKWLMLNAIDQAWKQHMLNLDHLKEGIGLRGMGQKNPLIEYTKEACVIFEEMMRAIRFEIIHHIYHLNMSRFDGEVFERERERQLEDVQLSGGSETEINKTVAQVVRSEATPGRNDECPCGSGKKFKKCHGK
jgi:preprotein translocase subunit SecA